MKVAQSCLTLCNPMDYTVRGILQARILEWVVGEHRYMGILMEKLYATILTDNCYCN